MKFRPEGIPPGRNSARMEFRPDEIPHGCLLPAPTIRRVETWKMFWTFFLRLLTAGRRIDGFRLADVDGLRPAASA